MSNDDVAALGRRISTLPMRAGLMSALCGLLLFFCSTSVGVSQGEDSSIHVLVIVASPRREGSDARLAEYVANLKRLLRFESFRVICERSDRIKLPGSITADPGRGHRFEIQAQPVARDRVRMDIRWFQQGKLLMHQTAEAGRAKPTVLLGPPTENDGEILGALLVID